LRISIYGRSEASWIDDIHTANAANKWPAGVVEKEPSFVIGRDSELRATSGRRGVRLARLSV